jgi:hypothetical protein
MHNRSNKTICKAKEKDNSASKHKMNVIILIVYSIGKEAIPTKTNNTKQIAI